MRELRSRAKSAVPRIEHLDGRVLNRRDDVGRNASAAAGKRFRLRDRVLDHGRLLDDIPVFLFVSVGDTEQHATEAGTSVSFIRREIRASIKRLTVGSEKRSQRPSALSAHSLHRSLVTAIDIRTLIAIDLY